MRNIEVFKSGTDLLPQEFASLYSEHLSIGIQRLIGSDMVLTGDFVRQFMHEDMGGVDLNHWNSVRGPVMPVCQGAQALDPKARCSAGKFEFRLPNGRSHYKGLLMRVDKRLSGRTQLLASYSLSDNIGFNGIVDKDNWFDRWGPRGGRQILNLSGMVTLPWDLQLSFISSMSSRGPFNATISGIDFNGDGTNGDRLPGTSQNQFGRGLGKSDLINLVNQFNQTLAGKKSPQGQTIPTIALPSSFEFGDAFSSQDLRLSKVFRLKERVQLRIMGEVFNLFNIANLGGYSGNLRETSAFGQPTSRVAQVFGSGGPRAFQMAARLTF